MTIQALSIKEGLATRLGARLARRRKLPANRVFVDPTEHLREAEGLDEIAAAGTLETRWKSAKSESPARARAEHWGCFYECQAAIGPASSTRKRWRAR
jgi:hypothetical protein